jgi:sec-independent protein translocase protein TatA|tara:strand:- start:32 stop:277 length:246 start_codon:yes stop_codon:yes gene_type:complete
MIEYEPRQARRSAMRVGPFGIPELVIILLVVMLIFGAKRLPEIGSSLGRSIRTFKSAVTGEDEKLGENIQAVQPKTSDDQS